MQRRKSGRDSEECERACNGEGNGNCDGPTDLEKEYNEANEKEGKAENENYRKGSKYKRDIRLVDAEGVHVTEAEGIGSVAQTVQVRSYPLEGDDADECSRETEHQAEEPEDIHTDAA